MERAVFTHHETDMPTLPHREVRWAMARGRSVVVEGFTLGASEEDKTFLAGLTGAAFAGRVKFEGCTFTIQLDLAEATFERTLLLLECTFEKGLRLRDASVGGRCSLHGSTVKDDERHWLDWRGIKTGRDLRLGGVTANAPIDLYGASVEGDLRIDGLHVLEEGRDEMAVRENKRLIPSDRHHVAIEMIGKALNLECANIKGYLNASPLEMHGAPVPTKRSTQIQGNIDLRANIEKHVIFQNAIVNAGIGNKAITMEFASVGGAVVFLDGTAITGSVALQCRTGGLVGFSNATVDAGSGGIAINMKSATYGGSVFFNKGTSIIGAVNLQASVGGEVNFNNANIDAGAGKTAINMDSATVGDSVSFRNGTRITGRIDLRARVKAQVEFVNATVNAEVGKIAVNVEGATIGRSIHFSRGTEITGSVDVRAKVAGQVAFDKTTINAGIGNTAVAMAEATVGGSVFFLNGTGITGAVDLRANVDGQVNLNSVTIDASTANTAILMNSARIGGSVFFRNRTHITGSVDLRAHVDGQVSFDNGIIEANTTNTAVNMENATVKASVFFIKGTRITGGVDLRARVAGQVSFGNTTVNVATGCSAVNMESATIGGPLFFRGGTILDGHVNLLQASLLGGLSTTELPNRDEFDIPQSTDSNRCIARSSLIAGNLVMDFAECGQAVILHELSVLGEIRARHLTVDGDLHLCGGVVGTVDEASFELAQRRATQLDAPADRLGWQPYEPAAASANSSATAVDIELAYVQGHLWIKGQRVRGGVNANLARVKGDANFDRSLIEGDLDLQDAKIEGVFEGKPSKNGEAGPLVFGSIDARGATFESVSIVLGVDTGTNAHAAADYLFDNAKVGTLRISGGTLQGQRTGSGETDSRWSLHRLRFDEIEVDGRASDDRRRISWHEWKWAGVFAVLAVPIVTALWLGGVPDGWLLVVGGAGIHAATAAIVACRVRRKDRDGQPRPIGEILLDGSLPIQPILDLLRASRFSAAFYVDVEHWARAAGDTPFADEVFLERRRRELCERRPEPEDKSTDKEDKGRPKRRGEPAHYSWFQKFARWIVFDIPFGYGVRWPRALHLFVLLWLLNWAVFLPHTAVERTLSAQAQVAIEREWGPQKAFFMAMRVQAPFVELFIDAETKPADKPLLGHGRESGPLWITYENYAAIMRILNLILVPVIIAGATGLLKPREAQYTGAS